MLAKNVGSIETSQSGLNTQLKLYNNKLAKSGKEFYVNYLLPGKEGNIILVGEIIPMGSRPGIPTNPVYYPPNLSTPPPLMDSSCTININEILINHTKGSATWKMGLGGPDMIQSTYLAISSGNYVFTPNSNQFRSEDSARKLVRFRCYTSLTQNDLPVTEDPYAPESLDQTVRVALRRYWKQSPTTSNNDQLVDATFSNPLGYRQSFQTNTPDYPGGMSSDQKMDYTGVIDPNFGLIGLGGLYGRYYYNFQIVIGADIPSGIYKFQFKLDFITL